MKPWVYIFQDFHMQDLGMPSKKKSPYGGTLSQLGGEGVEINFKMSLPKIPFY